MRVTLLKLLEELSRSVDFPEPIYEFGAFRVPGQRHLPRVRDYFPGKRYVGCDLHAGDGVDEIQDIEALTLPDGSVGTAILFDTIEHVRRPWLATAELRRCLKPGGIVLMTSVWYFPIHAYPDDYWRMTSSAFDALFEGYAPIVTAMCGLERLPHTVIGLASKGSIEREVEAEIQRIVHAWKTNGATGWKERLLDWMPPALLIPAYAMFLRGMTRLARPR